jgi:DNA-binding MarR family transcriptional regulator
MTASKPRDPVEPRLTNLMGALTLALGDRLRDATETAAAHAAAAPAALVALSEFLDGGTMDDLRNVVGLTPSGAVRLVDRLAGAGYVVRRPGDDARTVAIVLTAAGRRAAKRTLDARSAAISSVLADLPTTDRKALERIAERLLTAITKARLSARDAGGEPSGGWLCRLCDLDACGREQGRCPTALAAGWQAGGERRG